MNLQRTLTLPADEQHWLRLRAPDVTSTEVPALFALSPYMTEFELYWQKHDGVIPEIEPTDRMRWGTRLEAAIAQGIAEDEGLKIRKVNRYGRVMPLRMGASFDYEIVSHANGVGLFELKKVDEFVFKKEWIDDEAPSHIELQLQHQLEVLDRSWGVIGVLIGGNRARAFYRNRDIEIGAAIRTKVAEFWQRVFSDSPPPPDFSADAAFISRLFGHADPGSVYDARKDARAEELCRRYHEALTAEKECADRKAACKAEMLMLVGNAEKVLVNGFQVSAGMTAETPPTLVTEAMVGTTIGGRKGFRQFRVTKKD